MPSENGDAPAVVVLAGGRKPDEPEEEKVEDGVEVDEEPKPGKDFGGAGIFGGAADVTGFELKNDEELLVPFGIPLKDGFDDLSKSL